MAGPVNEERIPSSPRGSRARLCRVALEMAASFAPEKGGDTVASYHRVAGLMHHLCAAIREGELAGMARESILSAIAPARDAHAESPFVARLQRWPRGYPGDFETVEYLCDGRNRATWGTLGWAIEEYALRTAAAQQHRNKVAWQAVKARAVAYEAAEGGREARILSIACGGSRDIFAAGDELSRSGARLVLNDLDPAAVACSLERLRSFRLQITPVVGDIFMAQRRLGEYGPFDLVLAGGLFDYLDARRAKWLIERLTRLVRPGTGRLCLTNIAAPNPYRIWLEYLANWIIVERAEGELRDLWASCDSAVECLTLDTTGLTWLAEVRPAA